MRAHSFLSFFTTHSVNNLLNAFKKKSLLSEAPPKVQPKLFLLQFTYKCYIIEPDLAILTYNDVFIVTPIFIIFHSHKSKQMSHILLLPRQKCQSCCMSDTPAFFVGQLTL